MLNPAYLASFPDRGSKKNENYFSYFETKTYVVGTKQN